MGWQERNAAQKELQDKKQNKCVCGNMRKEGIIREGHSHMQDHIRLENMMTSGSFALIIMKTASGDRCSFPSSSPESSTSSLPRRKENLQKRSQGRVDKKKDRREKKLLRAGFEGRKAGFIGGGGAAGASKGGAGAGGSK